MTHYLPHILSLLIAGAGWFYLFYSQAAKTLSSLEGQAANRRRVRLRRAGGALMFVLAILIFAGMETIDPARSPNTFIWVWFGVMLVMFLILLLALMDVRLTASLRKQFKDGKP